MTITPDDVLAVIGRGRAQGKTVQMLALALSERKLREGCRGDLSWGPAAQRNVRAAVESLRRDGHPICATPETGYYIAESEAEMSETIAFLRSRAMTSLSQIARIRRVSLPVLMGQMQIELAAEGEERQHAPCRLGLKPTMKRVGLQVADHCLRCGIGPCTEGRSA